MKQVLLTGLTFGNKVWVAGETFDPKDYLEYANIFDNPERFVDVDPAPVPTEVEPQVEELPKDDPLTCPYCNRIFKQKGRLESHITQCTMNPENNLQPGVTKS